MMLVIYSIYLLTMVRDKFQKLVDKIWGELKILVIYKKKICVLQIQLGS